MILAIDTATRWLGLALHDGTAVVTEIGWRCLNNHTIELTPAIGDMLRRANVDGPVGVQRGRRIRKPTEPVAPQLDGMLRPQQRRGAGPLHVLAKRGPGS